MRKQDIIDAIRQQAAANGGGAPGQERFEAQTGVRRSEWFGKHWARWGDAIKEAGLVPNSLNPGYDESEILRKLANLTRRLGRYPPSGEIRLESRRDSSFPSHTVFDRLGRKAQRLQKLLVFCSFQPEFADIVSIVEAEAATVPVETVAAPSAAEVYGFVYVIRFGRHYKIGRTNEIGRRSKEIALELPEKTTLVHAIRTDDPSGIEAYWHRRFQDKRRNGEWFELNQSDLRAFKKRKFM